ncbi:MAG: HAD family hydrolase [Cyanobacteria bacterium P01_A01_bin.37]
MSLVFDSPGPLPQRLDSVQIVATDMDGTLTQNGKFSVDLIHALQSLQQAGISVIVVTGRSAGWVQSVVNYLPIWGAIAENGGVFFSSSGEQILFPDIEAIEHHRQHLQQTFQRCQAQFPILQESADNQFRLTDWTFSVEGLSSADLETLCNQAEADQWSFTYSTVQCHIKPRHQNKAIALNHLLNQYFPATSRSAVITVGDSPNDESLFDRQLVPFSVGVANIQHYLTRLQHHPTYITQYPEVGGFCELAQLILKSSIG